MTRSQGFPILFFFHSTMDIVSEKNFRNGFIHCLAIQISPLPERICLHFPQRQALINKTLNLALEQGPYILNSTEHYKY